MDSYFIKKLFGHGLTQMHTDIYFYFAEGDLILTEIKIRIQNQIYLSV